MTRNTRRIIFYLMVFAFFASAPPTILYAAGYSFDWKEWRLLKTGGIYLKSVPDQSLIFVDGKKSKKTPSFFPRLAPRTHNVRVEMNGYYPWEKNLTVYPQLVTEARNIFLFPIRPQAELIGQNATSTITEYLENENETKRKAQALQTASSTAAWILENEEIFYISLEDRNLYKSNLAGSAREQISKSPLPESDSYEIYVSPDQKKFAVLDSRKELMLLNRENWTFETFASDVSGAKFSNDNKRLLYYSQSEIWVFYIEEIMLQPYKKPGEREMITRFSQKIEQAIFYPDNDHIAFVVGDQIKVIEIDGRDRRNVVDFISAKSPQIHFDAHTNNFYYLSEGNLFRIKLKN